MTRWILLALAFLAIVYVLFLAYSKADPVKAEHIQRQYLGDVFVDSSALVYSKAGYTWSGDGSSIWIYDLAPGRFRLLESRCLDEMVRVDRRGDPNPFRRRSSSECFLYNGPGADGQLVQIILGDRTLEIQEIYY